MDKKRAAIVFLIIFLSVLSILVSIFMPLGESIKLSADNEKIVEKIMKLNMGLSRENIIERFFYRRGDKLLFDPGLFWGAYVEYKYKDFPEFKNLSDLKSKEIKKKLKERFRNDDFDFIFLEVIKQNQDQIKKSLKDMQSKEFIQTEKTVIKHP